MSDDARHDHAVEDGESVESPRRRKILTWLTASLGAVAAALVASPVVGFVIAPVRRVTQERWQRAGRVDRFAVGKTTKVVLDEPGSLPWAGASAREAVYLRRTEDEGFVAFSVYCTHTGCPLKWAEGAKLFLCPCHGGAFHADGQVAAGPPPTPLPRHDTRVRDGLVEVRTRATLLRGKS
jgi:menaquinol-cytochrome c reductase iron-sulfur subunit